MPGLDADAPKALIAWSSGKDSAWALLEARRAGDYEIVGGLPRSPNFGRVSMHGVREELLRAQLDAAGLPAIVVHIPFPCPNEIYERKWRRRWPTRSSRHHAHVFGDLFLEDVRAYRERQLAGTGITPVFPFWGRPTAALGARHDRRRRRGSSSTVDLKKLPAHSPAAASTARCLPRCPPSRPCGENGEFHSFVSAGPMLSRQVDTVERDGRYADLWRSASSSRPSGEAGSSRYRVRDLAFAGTTAEL